MIPYKQRKQAQQIMEAFTRQHYLMIANEIHNLKNDLGKQDEHLILDFTEALVKVFKNDNPNFEASRFKQACGF